MKTSTYRKKAGAKRERMARYSVTLPPSLVARLDEEAELQGAAGHSEIIRDACAEYLRRQAKRRGRDAEGGDG